MTSAKWAVPLYSRSAVDRAGAAYVNTDSSTEERELALAVINNWRSSHSFPLNTLQMNLRDTSRKFDSDPTIAQRIKRLPSIRHKLERFDGMKLSRMHDIGGARAVLTSMDGVDAVIDYYKSKSRMKHVLVREDQYILHPQPSGYRGVHLVYRYSSDRSNTYNGLRIELQVRSQLQHGWATAVETVGTFTQQALKSSLGEKGWLRFFALMGSALALREGTALVPGTPERPKELAKELRKHVKALDIVDRLTAYGQALELTERLEGSKGHTFLLELDMEEQELHVRSYSSPAVAAAEYDALERATEGSDRKDVVLVSVESLSTLRSAYPNYFLDTSAFLESVTAAIA